MILWHLTMSVSIINHVGFISHRKKGNAKELFGSYLTKHSLQKKCFSRVFMWFFEQLSLIFLKNTFYFSMLIAIKKLCEKVQTAKWLYKENSKDKKTSEVAIVKVSIRVLVISLLFVSHSCITLMLELDR